MAALPSQPGVPLLRSVDVLFDLAEKGVWAFLHVGRLKEFVCRGEQIVHRQQLQKDHPELFWQKDQGRDLVIHALSYPWLSKDHPDPHGIITERICKFQGLKDKTLLFWDFASLHQHPPGRERTEEETLLFHEALQSLPLLYGNQHPQVVFLRCTAGPSETKTAETGGNTRPYWFRGWCTFESFVANGKGNHFFILDVDTESGTEGPEAQNENRNLETEKPSVQVRKAQAKIPRAPADFRKLLEEKEQGESGLPVIAFTNASDCSRVADLYEAYARLFVKSLKELRLETVSLKGEGAASFLASFLSFVADCLEEEAGELINQEEVAGAVRKGKSKRKPKYASLKKAPAIPRPSRPPSFGLSKIVLFGTGLTDRELTELTPAFCRLSSLTSLHLSNNEDLTSEGVTALADALSRHPGVEVPLELLDLSWSPQVDDRCVEALARWAAGRHRRGVKVWMDKSEGNSLYVEGTGITDKGERLFADTLKHELNQAI
uniref:Uncharacterized protein n=1 Tax=Chromera velia CCMP2878 TaxID=1169474 RepID=A0A0G4F8J0_9ALVE|eukprot:Cvel_15768.t1-p1 / transcript=Cvel_15768.t1 / gene=Cvel_15768 / organism=Chromera_velia_CCMP2878 / gene_product=hypothetical protein / transcript_product=hypothetical protein / location=Cvel_scaffold1182:16233-20166(+) / protein_length=490 / sequence_SO=supercontig / SO=protein_coding / is_pseudo=false